jgi:hypothetical protein
LPPDLPHTGPGTAAEKMNMKVVFFLTEAYSFENRIMRTLNRKEIIMLSLPNLALLEARISLPFSRSGVKFFFPLSCFLSASSFS